MTVLDVFSILFTSNAADVKKDMEAAKKSTDDFQQQINTANETAANLGKSLLKVGLEAITAFTTFEGLKHGIIDAVNFNAELEKTAQITGASARQLAVYDATFSQFGGTTGEFVAWFQKASDIVNKTNGDVRNIIPNLKALANQMHALQMGGDEKGARQLFQIRKEQLGLPEDFYNTLIKGADAINLVADAQGRLINLTDGTAEAGLRLQSEFKELETAGRSFFTSNIQGAGDFLKLLETTIKGLRIFFDLFTLRGWKDIGTMFKQDFLGIDPGSSSTGSTPSGSLPLGMRNNNPGNLRSWGGVSSSGGFAQFPTLAAGLSAEQKQLQLYGNRGINTLSGIASTWAPSSENDTASYIAGLVKSTGFSANQRLDLNDPSVRAAIANAINKHSPCSHYRCRYKPLKFIAQCVRNDTAHS